MSKDYGNIHNPLMSAVMAAPALEAGFIETH